MPMYGRQCLTATRPVPASWSDATRADTRDLGTGTDDERDPGHAECQREDPRCGRVQRPAGQEPGPGRRVLDGQDAGRDDGCDDEGDAGGRPRHADVSGWSVAAESDA